MRKAAIDIGSNSVLLVVEEQSSNGWKVIHEASAVTSLGEGTKQTGLLREDRIKETLGALQDFWSQAQSHGAQQTFAGATMAARLASNTPDFLARADAQGTPVTVLTGEQEADLGFLAVASDPVFAEESRLSIIDIGGQSTEIVTADRVGPELNDWKILFRKSFSIGTLALLAGVLSDVNPGPAAILKAVGVVDDELGMIYRPNESGMAVVLGATGTNLVSIREKLVDWQPDVVNGQWLDYEEVSKAWTWLASLSLEERANIIGMEPGRERTLPAGALILERCLFSLRTLGCKVAVRGWRHAVLEFGMP